MRCILYARVSTDKQSQKDLSIPAQLNAMKEHAKRNGWKVIGHFVDAGESAKTANRPELNKLIQYCKSNKSVDAVIVHKIDRLARNLVDFGTIKAILKQKGIKLISVSEPFDDNPVGNLLENIIASISEWYSANLGEEIKKSNRSKLEKGEWPSKPPFGYKSVKNGNNRTMHIPDSNTAPIVKQAFQLYATEQYSLPVLSKKMAGHGLKTKLGNLYSPELLKKLLTRKFYIGKLVWNDKEYKGIHTPIIEHDLFYRVQEVLRKRSMDTGTKGRYEFLLRGVAYCAVCKRRLTGELHKRGNYYRCLPQHGKNKCSEKYTPVKQLDTQLSKIYERLQVPKTLLKILSDEMKEITKQREGITKKEIDRLKNVIEKILNKESKLADDMYSDKISRITHDRLSLQYATQRESAEKRLSQLDVDYRNPLDFYDKCTVISSMLYYLHMRFGFKGKQNLLRALFERIYVKDRQIVKVKLNPPFLYFMSEDIKNLFKTLPFGSPKGKIIEQLFQFMLSDQYQEMKNKVEVVVRDLEDIYSMSKCIG